MGTVVWLSLAIIFYTFIGYPIVLFLLNQTLKNEDSHLNNYFPTVEVIMIVRNASQLVKAKIHSLNALTYPKDRFKILIVSDASQDDTVVLIKQFDQENIRCVNNSFKSTKSACINQAVRMSSAEIIFLTDVRQTLDSSSLQKLTRHFADERVGAVSGELILLEPETNNFSQSMDAYWRYEKFIRHQESQLASVPGVTGAIYAIRRRLFQPIPEQTLLDDVLIPMNVILQGKRVLFEPQALAFDVPSADVEREKKRKTRTLAGNWQMLALQPKMLNPFRNSIWWQLVSHKILRLFCPFLLFALYLSSAILSWSGTTYFLLFLVQTTAYLSVVLANFLPVMMNISIIRMAHSFLLLMWFSLLGFWSFITNRHLTIWK